MSATLALFLALWVLVIVALVQAHHWMRGR